MHDLISAVKILQRVIHEDQPEAACEQERKIEDPVQRQAVIEGRRLDQGPAEKRKDECHGKGYHRTSRPYHSFIDGLFDFRIVC